MSELYTKYEFAGSEYFKCIECDFYTKFLSSIKRHIEQKKCKLLDDKLICVYCSKEFNYPIDIQRHLNRKKKCYIDGEILVKKQIKKKIDNNINELTKQIEQLSNENKSLKETIICKESSIKLLETRVINNKIFLYNNLSNVLLDRDKNKMFLYDIEYHLLYNAITEHRDPSDNDEQLKEKLYLMMSYMKQERFTDFFNSVKKDYQYLIPFIVDYYKYLKTIDDKKINGKNRDMFMSDIRVKINVYFGIELL
jgi:hypothetical protein